MQDTGLTITALTRKTAILEIFSRCEQDQIGSSMLLTELMQAWPETGLRADDLAACLNEMLAEGSLRLDFRHYDSAVFLTESGKAWLDGIGVETALLAEQQRILAALHQRSKNPPPPNPEQEWPTIDRRHKEGD